MQLDDTARTQALDPEGMLAHVAGLPDQVEAAWSLAEGLDLPAAYSSVRRVVICGLGGSAIGASLVQALVEAECPVPVSVLRDYALPACVSGPDTLVIGSSHSGNTEETLSAFDQAHARGGRMLAICTGGQLAERAERYRVPLWRFEHRGQPRAAVGYSLVLILAVLARLGFVSYSRRDVTEAAAEMRMQQKSIGADIDVAHNPAKRLAGQLMGRYVVVFASGLLAPVARRWKGQINEIAKAWAQFEILPEADHNTVAGTLHPEAHIDKFAVIFLRSSFDHPRNAARADATRELLMTQGFTTDGVHAVGVSPLAQMLTAVHFGDYTAYYLAMGLGVDPTPVPQIQQLKARLAELAP